MGHVQLYRLLPEQRPNDRSCDHSQQPLGPSDNAGTNSDSPGVLVAAEPLLGPGDLGVRVPDRGRAPFGCAHHDRTDLLASDVIGEPDHRDLDDARMACQYPFNLARINSRAD